MLLAEGGALDLEGLQVGGLGLGIVGQLAVEVGELMQADGIVGGVLAELRFHLAQTCSARRKSLPIAALPEQLGDLFVALCDRFRHMRETPSGLLDSDRISGAAWARLCYYFTFAGRKARRGPRKRCAGDGGEMERDGTGSQAARGRRPTG